MDSLMIFSEMPDTVGTLTKLSPDTVLDPTKINGFISIKDTVSVVDIGNYLYHPAFWVSVISVFVAIILPPLMDRYRERRRLRRLKSYTEYLTSSLLDSFQLRARVFGKLSKELKDIDSRERRYIGRLGNSASVLLNMPADDLFRAFIGEKKKFTTEDKVHFKFITDALEYYSIHEDYGKKNFELFINDIRRYESVLTESLDQTIRLFDKFVSILQREHSRLMDDGFLYGADRIISTWQKDDKSALISTTKEKLLTPLKAHCVQFSTDPRAVDMLERLIKCNYSIMNINAAHSIYRSAFLQVAVTLVRKKRESIRALDYFFPNWRTEA